MAMTTKQAAEKWGISDRRVRTLCANGQIDGAWREGKLWFVPDNAQKPSDGRIRGKETLLAQIERKKIELDGRRPLTEGEVARLNEDFMIEYTYNSNAIEGNTLTLRADLAVFRSYGLRVHQTHAPFGRYAKERDYPHCLYADRCAEAAAEDFIRLTYRMTDLLCDYMGDGGERHETL